MSEKGGSDLDVFENLSKGSPPARKKTLLGLNIPPGPASAPSSRGSLPPPPPPSLRTSVPPPLPPGYNGGSTPQHAEAAELAVEDVETLPVEDVETLPVEDVETLPVEDVEQMEPTEATSSPIAAPQADLYGEDDATQVFAGLDSSPEASIEPPTPLMPELSSSTGSAAPSTGPLPPPPAPPASFRSSGPPPPPPTPAPAAPSADEWDEDDDKTSIFNRESGFDAAHVLMGAPSTVGSVPDLPPPPMSRPSAPIPTSPAISMPQPGVPRIESAADSVPPAPTNKIPLTLAVVCAIALGAALLFVLRPSTGGLVVTVAGEENKPADSVEVLVDGKLACSSSPCTLEDLTAGPHMVQARAKGYQENAETAVLVTSGQDAVHNIRLARASGTGIKVSGTGAGLRLLVNGKDIGPLPQELGKLAPGSYQLKVVSEHFEPWEKQVTVTADQLQPVEVPPLKVTKGLAIIKAGDNADGARVVLEADGDRRILTSLPMNLHIDTSKPHKLTATKRGYSKFREEVTFEDGQAERTFEIELGGDEAEETTSARSTARSTRRSGGSRSNTSTRESAPASSGKATLNLNSIPVANVIVDGRPVGKTPKMGVSVSAGKHTVVFVHGGQRVAKSVTAEAGKSATVVHRFK